MALAAASGENDRQETQILDRAIHRAIITCYAVEGKYPSSLDYLCTNYGVSFDESRYIVRYDVFASNVMPSVTITEIGGGQ